MQAPLELSKVAPGFLVSLRLQFCLPLVTYLTHLDSDRRRRPILCELQEQYQRW